MRDWAAACLAALACAGAAHASEARTDTPSDKPVPRFESLRASEARGRVGPSREHRVLWEYRRAGLPVEVIAETEEWRRVRDPDGVVTWMNRRLLSSRRTVIIRPGALDGVALRAEPDATSRVRALLQSGVVADLESCADGWCRLVVAGRHEGWAPQSALWGAG
jgi:SH3-like domain-containing protein